MHVNSCFFACDPIARSIRCGNTITGEEARIDVHKIRAESDAICVGAGTVRSDDPSLTVTSVDGPNPRRIVIGEIPEGAQVEPAESWKGPLGDLIQKLGDEGVLQLLVEGGADLAGQMHREGLVDRYVIYISPSIMGGDDGKPLLSGDGVSTMESKGKYRLHNGLPVLLCASGQRGQLLPQQAIAALLHLLTFESNPLKALSMIQQVQLEHLLVFHQLQFDVD
jgi:riboflavin biosynthesis pyrimidine reductase